MQGLETQGLQGRRDGGIGEADLAHSTAAGVAGLSFPHQNKHDDPFALDGQGRST